MKKSLLFIICHLSFSVALTSCSDHSEAEAMRQELLLARAMNTDFVPFTTDSVMKEVVAYYDRHGTSAEKMEAHYLLGCVYRDLGEAPKALKCYQDAVGCADTTRDNRLLIKVYGQMAELFDAQNLPGDEIAAMREIQRLALQEQDSLMYIRALELMTKPYYKLADTAKVIETIQEAHRLYTERGDSQKAVNAFATLAHIMVKRGQLNVADSLLREYETQSGLFDGRGNIERGHEMYYYIKGNYYLEAGKPDSAEAFFRKLLPDYYPADAFRGLLSVYQKRRDPDSIAKYARLFEEAIDSLNNTRRIETVHQMAALYDYHRYQQQADVEALAAAKARNRANIAIGLIVLLSIAACALLIWYRKRKQQQLDRLSKEYLVISGMLAKARMELDEERKDDEVKELEGKLQQLEEQYRNVTQLASMEKRKNSEAVRAIREKAEWKYGVKLPTADDWIKLTNQFRLDFPCYYSTLVQGKKLATNELRTSMLLMLDFKEGEIAVLLDVKPQRVTNIKKRVNTKLFDDSSATTLVSNIQAASKVV